MATDLFPRAASRASRPRITSARLQKAPLGYFYDVITNGFGIMPDYSSQIPPRDRWNIVAYIRALQLSQNATKADVPAGQNVPSEPPKFLGDRVRARPFPVIAPAAQVRNQRNRNERRDSLHISI